jgi:hypothetical protein
MLARVRGWILSGNESAKEPCKAICLFHFATKGQPIETWLIESDSDPDVLVSSFIDAAEQDAAGIGGTQRFMICAYFANSRPGVDTWGARLPFIVHAPPTMQTGMGSDDPFESFEDITSPKALAAATGRMMLDHQRLVVPWANEQMRMAQRMIDSLQKQVETLSANHQRMVILQEKLLSRHHERQMKLKKLIMWEKRKDEIAGIIMPMMGPVLMGILSGGKPGQLPPATPTEETSTFEDFIRAVKDDMPRLQALQATLHFNQQPAVMQMVASVMAGQTIQIVVLREFVKSIDDAQMKAWEEILSEEQFGLLKAAIRGIYMKHEQVKEEVRKAYEDMRRDVNDPLDPEDDPLGDDEGLDID